eukprot:4725990-Ditylum_brightwellii.AAC.1
MELSRADVLSCAATNPLSAVFSLSLGVTLELSAEGCWIALLKYFFLGLRADLTDYFFAEPRAWREA